jgi:hypothetical protein
MSAALDSDLAGRFLAVVDELLATDFSGYDGPGLLAVMAAFEVGRRRLDAVEVSVLAAAEERRRDGEFAATTLIDLLVQRLYVDPAEAARRVHRAEELRERRTLGGEVLPPVLPRSAAALTAGEISGRHAEVIGKYVAKVEALPDAALEAGDVAERLMVQASRHDHPKAVARLGEALLARLDPDGSAPRDAELDRHRGFSLLAKPDGSALARGTLTPEATAAWQAIFDALAAPVPDADGSPDPRTPAQRRHDALLEAGNRLLRGDLAPGGGTPLTMLVRIDADQLPASLLPSAGIVWDGQPARDPAGAPAAPADISDDAGIDGAHDLACSGIGVTAHGALISLARLAPQLCEAELVATVLNAAGGVLAFGRARRLATRAQRLALAARDGGCSFPGCTRPPAWCEAHHVIPWERDGLTDLDNLCLVCPYHHRHFERLCWEVVMIDGVPKWIPPPWVDPHRTPIRNTAHHLDLDFNADI